MPCDNLEGWDTVGRRFKREGTYVCLWLIHVDVWQKPTQFCKAIILKLKSFLKDPNFQLQNKCHRYEIRVHEIESKSYVIPFYCEYHNWVYHGDSFDGYGSTESLCCLTELT